MQDTCRYKVDSLNRIVWVGDDWLRFANANEAPQLSQERVTNRPLFDFVSDLDTVHLYRLLLERLRETGEDIVVPFRCDSPTHRRFMELRMTAIENGGVLFESALVREEPRDYVALLDPLAERSAAHCVKLCGWCKKVRIPDQRWLEVEDAVGHVPFFTGDQCPRVTHGMCPNCFDTVKKRLTN